jgi:hypothetical protein
MRGSGTCCCRLWRTSIPAVADRTSTDVASAVLVAAGILLIVVLRYLLRFMKGRMRWVAVAVTVIAVICAGAYLVGAGARGR